MHDVEQIYQIYPRKVGKRAAIRAIGFALTRLHDGETGKPMGWGEAAELLKKTTKEFASSLAGRRGIYTPYPATFFNQSRYLDDQGEWDLLTREEYEDAMQSSRMSLGTWKP